MPDAVGYNKNYKLIKQFFGIIGSKSKKKTQKKTDGRLIGLVQEGCMAYLISDEKYRIAYRHRQGISRKAYGYRF